MFSYGFQPWAALTGQQILEAIDEPNFQVVLALNIFIIFILNTYAFQRLEQPDCCPKEYFNVMTKCWQHEIAKRPKFADLVSILLDVSFNVY